MIPSAPSPSKCFPNDGFVAKVKLTCTKDFGLLRAGTVLDAELQVRCGQERVVVDQDQLPNATIHPILFTKNSSGGHWDKFVMSA